MPGKMGTKLPRFFNKRENSNEDASPEEIPAAITESPSLSSEEDGSELARGYQTPREPHSQTFIQARQHALSIMARHTYQEARKEQLICPIQDEQDGGESMHAVALKIARGHYAFWPRGNEAVIPFVSALCQLNVGSAMTLVSTVTQGIVDMIPPAATEVAITSSLHIQVLQDTKHIATARKAQGAAFVLSERCVVIWSDEPFDLLSDARRVHSQLARFLWAVAGTASPPIGDDPHQEAILSPRLECSQTPAASVHGHGSSTPSWPNFPSPSNDAASAGFSGSESGSGSGNGSNDMMASSDSRGQLVLAQGNSYEKADDLEEGYVDGYEERPTVILSSITHGLACALAMAISGLQVRQAFVMSLLDGVWLRMAIAVVCPCYFVLVQFFCDNIIQNIFMLLGPVRQLQMNSRYYSGVRPKPLRAGAALPHITIQMPVYKEDFNFVLRPSFESIKRAIRTYELQGGSASIIVSEDGMVLLTPEERELRLTYYEDNNITWIARPKHGKDGFIREGRFKKASNLNFTYDVLLKTEKMYEEEKKAAATHRDESEDKELYGDCLNRVLQQIHPDACGSGIDKFGEYILLIDSDTRVPSDCFLDAATEMTQCKDVGILQHCSGVMIVTESFFERCIAFFTRLVNFSISYAVANGDVAPFMGHNAYLRWSALKEIGKTVTLADGREQLKIWSESHVSEDFVMALDMIELGYTVRWATYSKSEYLEGVSLTCDDELNRWQKYAWGVSEMIFNPIKRWYRGPITPLFRRFLWGNAPVHYKWASCSYCFSYYAIGLALFLTLGLTLVQGWIGSESQAPYIPSFQVLVACLVVFTGVGTVALCIVRFRAGQGDLLRLLGENILHIPFLVVFFGGLSYHVFTSLFSHLIGINMTWGATLKDLEMTNFFLEVPLIFRRHYRLLLLCSVLVAGMGILSSTLVPLEWRIEGLFVVFPFFFLYSLHLLFPIVLNPNLVRFSF